MVKRTMKNDPQQKNKQGFDSSKQDAEFSKEIGSAEANKKQKEKAKQRRADNWDI